MGKKFQFNPLDLQDKPMGELQAYQEGPLAVFKIPDGEWVVAHIQTRTRITGNKSWKQKNQARDYALTLLEYAENGLTIDWDFDSKADMLEKNDEEFLKRAWKAGLKNSGG